MFEKSFSSISFPFFPGIILVSQDPELDQVILHLQLDFNGFSSCHFHDLFQVIFNIVSHEVSSFISSALLPLDLLLKAPSIMFRAHVKSVEDSLVTGWKSHSLPAVILRTLKDHGST